MTNSIHQSIFFSALERYGSVFFFVISTAVLSRLLTPQEFGIYAVVGALTTVAAASFQEFGGANYLIQKTSLSELDVRTAFTITLCLSAIFAVAVFELRDVAAWFFSEDGLKSGIAISALTFFLSPFSMTITALLRRDMRFGIIARCNLAGNFVTAVASVVLAALGYSFMAPIWGLLVGNAVVLALLIASQRNLRIFLPSLHGYRDVLGFGAYSSGTILINILYSLSPQLILARVLDFNVVGLYSRAINVTQVFERTVIQVFNPVIMPAVFAHTKRGGDLKRIYLNAVELLSVVQWPFLAFVALMAEPIVWIWFGPTWMEVVPLIRMLCVGSLSLFAACLTYPVLVAAGSVRDTLVSSLISLPPSLLMIFIASFFGVQAVAASALVTLPFQAVVAFYFVSKHLKIKAADVARATVKSGIVAVCTIAGAFMSMVMIEIVKSGAIAAVLTAGACGVAGWWLGLLMTDHPLLAQLRLVASRISFGGFIVPRIFTPRWEESASPDGKSR